MKYLVLLSLIFVGCAHSHQESAQQLDVKITDSLSGHRWDNIYFSRQPNEKELKGLKENNFNTVINLRTPSESGYMHDKEEDIMRRQKINYYNVPFSMKNDVTNEFIAEVTEKIKKHRDQGNILVHCKSGSRAGLWLGAHFKKDHKFSNSKSFKLAIEMGLKSPVAQMKLKKYLDQ